MKARYDILALSLEPKASLPDWLSYLGFGSCGRGRHLPGVGPIARARARPPARPASLAFLSTSPLPEEPNLKWLGEEGRVGGDRRGRRHEDGADATNGMAE